MGFFYPPLSLSFLSKFPSIRATRMEPCPFILGRERKKAPD